MKIIVKRAGYEPEVKEIESELSEFQEIVKGYIECLPIGENILCVCNEEGKLRGLKPNFAVGNDIICGDAFFCSQGYEDFESLNEYQIELILNALK